MTNVEDDRTVEDGFDLAAQNSPIHGVINDDGTRFVEDSLDSPTQESYVFDTNGTIVANSPQLSNPGIPIQNAAVSLSNSTAFDIPDNVDTITPSVILRKSTVNVTPDNGFRNQKLPLSCNWLALSGAKVMMRMTS